MSKKGLLALCLAIILPLVSYLAVKHFGDEATVMPPKYFPDQVNTRVVDGKQITDTVWHTAKDIRLVNQLGDTVNLSRVQGKILVIDFFFTHCGSICPQLTTNMKQMQDRIKHQDKIKYTDTSFVQFISMSIDPERDSVPVLKKYADRYHINPDNWWLLTGDKKTIYDFAFEELKVDKYNDEPVDSAFVHTSRFTLLDRDRVVRGFYNGLDEASLEKLSSDMVFLTLEKDKHRKSELFEEIKSIWPIFVITILAVVVFLLLNRKPKF